MIEIKGLIKNFGEKQVLKGIDAIFEEGKSNMIIGSSGSGKTVFMKCLIGLMIPEEGTISYEGQDFLKLSFKEKMAIRKDIGMLFQYSALFSSMTIEENIAFPLRLFTKKSNKEIVDRVNFCLDRVNLEKVNQLYPDEISGGMKKRAGIARAIVMNPKYLFCDEPNSGLDPLTSNVIDKLIHEITKEFNTTTIINTHDMNSVLEYGEHIIFLYQGEKYWEGSKEEIKESGNEKLNEFIYASDFIKDKQINLDNK
jgi:phospholipid/cholesterol/gamma-HCH transport system ATP-binding protein